MIVWVLLTYIWPAGQLHHVPEQGTHENRAACEAAAVDQLTKLGEMDLNSTRFHYVCAQTWRSTPSTDSSG